MLYARMGDSRHGTIAQDGALRTIPASLPRFSVYIEFHRGLMLAKAGDKAGGIAYTRAALSQLPVQQQHTPEVRLKLAEVEQG